MGHIAGIEIRDRATVAENLYRAILQQRQFALVFEVIPPNSSTHDAGPGILSLVDAVSSTDVVAAVAVGDRIRTDEDTDPVTFARSVADRTGRQPLVHVAGKDRSVADVVGVITRMREAGLQNALLMTGDRIKNRDRERAQPIRYCDSVNMIELFAEGAPELLIGAVVNPFKHVYEDLANQMLKLEKKLRAGAEFVVAQIGFSWRVYRRLLEDCAHIAPGAPVLATAAYLSPGVARLFHSGRVPGVIIPAELLRRVESEQRDGRARMDSLRRLATQILTLKGLGYAGVHISAVHTRETAEALLEALAALEAQRPTLEDLARRWDEDLPGDAGKVRTSARYATPSSPVSTAWRERFRYRALHTIDELLFAAGAPFAKTTGAAVRTLAASSTGDRLLRKLEHTIKHPLVGCQMCGFCRLPQTMYVCPETCPKGLANGPCGGAVGGVCEFGDRPCIHNEKLRIATLTGRVRELAETIVPPVPEQVRGHSSWVTHFQDPARLGRRIGATAVTPPLREREGKHE